MLQNVFLRSSLIVFLLLFSCRQKKQDVPYYNTPDFEPQFLSKEEASDKINHTIQNFSFVDQDNRVITDKITDHKIHIASFIFTSCGSICPNMIRNLKLVDRKYKNDPDVILLSFSVTPWIDTSEKLKDFKTKHKITNANWHFLTGNKNEIYSLARKSYFAEEALGFTRDSAEFLHTEHIILVDGQRKIRGIYNGTLQSDMQQLITDIDLIKKNTF
ncbi:SCO family protein [Chryseobacterium nepalense]|uniref:SCO family protein n=1 Tax=Chryseobacterium nepalense TaxID=1854498 RepID=UPI002DFC2F6D|nr:protein SCO1/2 [Chryseobacterium nepalense]